MRYIQATKQNPRKMATLLANKPSTSTDAPKYDTLVTPTPAPPATDAPKYDTLVSPTPLATDAPPATDVPQSDTTGTTTFSPPLAPMSDTPDLMTSPMVPSKRMKRTDNAEDSTHSPAAATYNANAEDSIHSPAPAAAPMSYTVNVQGSSSITLNFK